VATEAAIRASRAAARLLASDPCAVRGSPGLPTGRPARELEHLAQAILVGLANRDCDSGLEEQIAHLGDLAAIVKVLEQRMAKVERMASRLSDPAISRALDPGPLLAASWFQAAEEEWRRRVSSRPQLQRAIDAAAEFRRGATPDGAALLDIVDALGATTWEKLRWSKALLEDNRSRVANIVRALEPGDAVAVICRPLLEEDAPTA
jgi:hypothetical protein